MAKRPGNLGYTVFSIRRGGHGSKNIFFSTPTETASNYLREAAFETEYTGTPKVTKHLSREKFYARSCTCLIKFKIFIDIATRDNKTIVLVEFATNVQCLLQDVS